MQKKLFCLGLVLLLGILCFTPGFSQERTYPLFQLEAWFPTVNGSISPGGSNINLRDDLNLKSNTLAPGAKVFWPFLGRQYLSLGYTGISNSGNSRLNHGFVYQGKTFTTGTLVESKLKLYQWDARYGWTMSPDPINNFNVFFGLKTLNFSSSVAQTSGTAEQSFNLVYPQLGLGFSRGIGQGFNFFGDISATGSSGGSKTMSSNEWRAGFGWKSVNGWGLDAAYRNLFFTGKDDQSNSLNFQYGGPVISLKYQY